MNYIIVKLWGDELGRLAWNPARRQTYFMFNPRCQSRPDVAPLLCPIDQWNSNIHLYGDPAPVYQGLPPFIADSLPDSWGNRLFDKWVKDNRISRSYLTPLYKLLFIGRRGMGALEYEPAAKDLEHPRNVDIDALYRLSADIAADREKTSLSPSEPPTLQALLAVGTSAGGRQMKAIVAIDPTTGDIRSGQTVAPSGYDYCIIKFQDERLPTSEIEMTYHDMAIRCGIMMEECRLFNAQGINHFLTRRFDRKNGEKVHMQTLAAINPEATSYEDLMATCRALHLTERELIEVFRRLAFNVMSNNTDDHNKNFSFLLDRGRRWRLAPAYDMTFIFNAYATGPHLDRRLSLYGKTTDITRNDLLEFAHDNAIRNATDILDSVAEALSHYPELAHKYDVKSPWSQIIERTISANLSRFGYATQEGGPHELIDSHGRSFRNLNVTVNSKGHYEIKVTINGEKRRNFVRPNMELYSFFQEKDFLNRDRETRLQLLEQLFPTV